MEVVFEVASQRYVLDGRAATLMAEKLRVKAAYPGRGRAEAVVDTLDVTPDGGDRPLALYYAVKRLHDERLRLKS